MLGAWTHPSVEISLVPQRDWPEDPERAFYERRSSHSAPNNGETPNSADTPSTANSKESS
jgi:hypothetical protein